MKIMDGKDDKDSDNNSNSVDPSPQQMEEGRISASVPDNNRQTRMTSNAGFIPPQKARDWFQLTQEIQGNAAGAIDILNDVSYRQY